MQYIDDLNEEVEELLDNLENRPSDRKEILDELRNILSDTNAELERIKEELENAEQQVRDFEDYREQVLTDPQNYKEPSEEEVKKVYDAVSDAQEAIEILEEIQDKIRDALSNKGVFDKEKCFRNIRYYMQIKGVRIGQIEALANCRVGYMSRLSKPGNTSEPSIMFIASAAKLLGVTMDELIYGEPEELSSDEKYVVDFLHDLINDTNKDNMHWEKERDDILRRNYRYFDDQIPEHPLLTIDEGVLDSDGSPFLVRYISQFYKESAIIIKGCYSANLSGKDKVYLVWCSSEKNDEYIPDKTFFEIYVTGDDGKANPVCNTLKSAESLKVTIYILYKMAADDAASVHINKATKSIIDNYRSISNLPF